MLTIVTLGYAMQLHLTSIELNLGPGRLAGES